MLEATPLVERQLALVRARQKTLAQFAASLEKRLEELHAKNAKLSKNPSAKGPDVSDTGFLRTVTVR